MGSGLIGYISGNFGMCLLQEFDFVLAGITATYALSRYVFTNTRSSRRNSCT